MRLEKLSNAPPCIAEFPAKRQLAMVMSPSPQDKAPPNKPARSEPRRGEFPAKTQFLRLRLAPSELFMAPPAVCAELFSNVESVIVRVLS